MTAKLTSIYPRSITISPNPPDGLPETYETFSLDIGGTGLALVTSIRFLGPQTRTYKLPAGNHNNSEVRIQISDFPVPRPVGDEAEARALYKVEYKADDAFVPSSLTFTAISYVS